MENNTHRREEVVRMGRKADDSRKIKQEKKRKHQVRR
jgi:hypothetical protein